METMNFENAAHLLFDTTGNHSLFRYFHQFPNGPGNVLRFQYEGSGSNIQGK